MQYFQIDAPIQFQELVDTMRKLMMNELKQVDQFVSFKQIIGGARETAMEQLFIDALASAGTRNTLALFVEKVMKEQVPVEKAIQALLAFPNLPAPSDSQVKLIQQLCQSGVAEKSAQLKQACWLTFGTLLNIIIKIT